jgi:iron complex outermembrane receptor protein/hemoglobin/transferrin/lactoferrin receptor protein
VTLSWTLGEGPNLAEPPADPRLPYEARVPLSRIPPLNGTAELRWFHRTGFTAGAGLRWATPQDRLAVADRSDARIPFGGTPGFAVLDLRAAWRHRFSSGTALVIAAVAENLFDTAYRYHGSAVNGPGRGAMFNVEVKP